LDLNPKVRRWDQSIDQADGVGLMRLNQPDIELEHGIRVNFATGFYRQGDYWTFPARTAPIGDVEWVPAGEHLPHGVRHHFAPLAFVYNGPSDDSLSVLTDCRHIFPPLTAITAQDVSFDDLNCNLEAETVQDAIDALCRSNTCLCTVTIDPDTDIENALGTIPAGSDIYLCFRMGEYSLNQPITLADMGHVYVTGAGGGTRLRALGQENVFRFDNCASVTIRDLHAETNTANVGDELGGTLEFHDCAAVTVEHTALQCGHGISRRAACIKVLNTRVRVNATHGTVGIRHNTLRVGHLQTGILLVNTSRAHVEDNQLMTYEKPSSIGLRALAAARNLTYLTPIARSLLTNIVATTIEGATSTEPGGRTGPEGNIINERLVVPGLSLMDASINVPITSRHAINIISPDPIIDSEDWVAAINDEHITINEFELASSGGVSGLIDAVGINILLNEGNIGSVANNWQSWFRRADADDVSVMGQGIVIAGEIAQDVRILDNTLNTCIQGVHVGLSRENSIANLQSESVVIAQNTVAVSMPTAVTGERHGIFVGNTESCLIENNYLTVDRFPTTTKLSIDAIRVFGIWGSRVYVRGNHVHNRGNDSFSHGVRFNPLNNHTPRRWLVSDNIASVRVTGDFADLVTVRDNAA
jgi:hypothetical protein